MYQRPDARAVQRNERVNLSVAYSPCPNDTFIFNDLANGKLTGGDLTLDVHLHDVETLNRMALDGVYDVTKVSFHAYLLARRKYDLLSVGAALGHGCGPIVVARREIGPDEFAGCTIAVPGELTTAHLLLRLWAPQFRRRVFVRYDEVMDRVSAGQADAGVIIHEGRFVYERAGLVKLADLGEWWQGRTGLPIPLGGIVARRGLGAETIGRFEDLLRQAIRNSLDHPGGTAEYVREHAREMDPAVLKEHIKTFVNDYSLDMGDDGRAAIRRMADMARDAGFLQ